MEPKVSITADVHHYVGYYKPQADDCKFALRYQDILEKVGGCATYFVTGKCIDLHKDFWISFSKKRTEIGGHTYWAMHPKKLMAFNIKFFKSFYGPKPYQWLDIKKTMKAFRSIGLAMKCWRTHMYCMSPFAYSILKKEGIEIVSDKREKDLNITKENGLFHVPITCLTDDNIHRCFLENDRKGMESEKEKIEKDILSNIKARKDIVIHLHSLHMKVLDDFEFLTSIVEALKKNGYRFCTLPELVRDYQASGMVREGETKDLCSAIQ